ncbi:F-box/FBD/LRR-repeat protein At4g00160-like, partial [Hibiscus syriacus]|uniref:F-box/FBD/LRR-repeat protein At4g00160-like n=1 Tax=Hibiscus syriacus TaxID=106335 RepID=UPI0019206A2A
KQVEHDEEYRRDLISELPDDVLIRILSFLNPEDAVLKTRFLSHRWKQLWEFWPAVFSFDGLITVDHGRDYAKCDDIDEPVDDKFMENLERKRIEFVKWVSNVLISHQGSTFDELRVRFDLIKDSRRDIDKWIEIAMRKKVKRLELDIRPLLDWNFRTYYAFPQECFHGIEFLDSLCLKHVEVTDKTMESILSNCPMLESLRLGNINLLRHPKVSGSSLRLKHLHISECQSVESIEVSAPNLVSFEYHEERLVTLDIRHAPKFTELYYYKRPSSKIADIVSQLSNYLPQLQILRLNISSKDDLSMFPKCTNLRYLNCQVKIKSEDRLTNLRTLIEASPYLCELKLEITNFNHYRKNKSSLGKVDEVELRPNQYMKKVEIVGFLGEMEEAEFVTYLVKSAINLEKIILHSDVCSLQIIYSEEFAEATKQMAQNFARQLLKNRPGVELVLL